MKFKKVLISLMLSLAMVFTALPAMAFAEPVANQDSSQDTESPFLTELQKALANAKLMLTVVGTASKDELRMISYTAVCLAEVEFNKRFGECNALFNELKDKAPDYIAEHSSEITFACAQLLQAVDELDSAIKVAAPKIQNYLKLAAKTKGIKVKVVRKKGYTFAPIKLVTTDGERYVGKVTYKGKFLNKKSKKALKFSTKTGKITIRKGAKKGTYKIRVTAKAGGDGNYMPCTLVNKTVKIKVR